MPCYSPPCEAEDRKIHELEALLCAALSELEIMFSKEEFYKFLDKASENSLASLNAFWELHQGKDTERLNDLMDKLSYHEILKLKTILEK